jgi:ketosteroid isomerase-like protein
MTQNLETAKRAFAAWERGENTGDYQEFKNLLGANFSLFSHPMQPSRGEFIGAEALQKMSELIAARERFPNNLKFSKITATQSGDTFVFLFNSQGKVAGGFSYEGWNAIVLIINNHKVVGFREYFGDVEPAWFKAD